MKEAWDPDDSLVYQARPSLLLVCKQQISFHNLNTKGKEASLNGLMIHKHM